MTDRKGPLCLIILDGWGYREAIEDNAIAQANTPFWDKIWAQYPHTLISGSGRCVGLPHGQMGNSEVGHLNMGAGRLVYQDFTRIEAAIEDGSFFQNAVLNSAIDESIQANSALHIFGLVSPGGVHSHENQITAALQLAAEKGARKVYVHAFLDGRDTPPQSAENSLRLIDATCEKLQCGKIASIIGRYYAMDRDQRWERVQAAYDLLTLGRASAKAQSAVEGLHMAYARGENDEFVKATSIHAEHESPVTVADQDVILFMNFRADRARELCHAFLDEDFTGFVRSKIPKLTEFVTLTEYEAGMPTKIAYPPSTLNNILGEYLSTLNLKQLRIAETEKYAHITFFFNGGIEQAYPNEDRVLIPSPRVATYDLKPEMSAPELTERLIAEIKTKQYDFIVVNFANPDMVGHTGNLPAAIQAIEVIDSCLEKIIMALQAVDGEAIITADHGNVEMMFDKNTQQPHTAHTSELVPFIYVGRPADIVKINGTLCDVAPSILSVMNLAQPYEMTGQTLLQLK